MGRSTLLPLALALLVAPYTFASVATNNFNLVDPFIGSLNGGNVFVGASLPFGMAKAVADVAGENSAGFAFDFSNVTGFSALHDSGTGGAASMGNFPLSVQPFCPDDVIDNCKFGTKYARAVNYKPESPKAEPGYFALSLGNDVNVEMTVTEHTALYNFNFTNQGTSPLVLLDLTDLQDSRQNASISVNPETGRIMGNGTFLPSFGVGSYQNYFCADFKGASIRDTGIWVNERAGTEPKELSVNRGYSLFYIQAGGFVRFAEPASGTIQARMGVSFFSTEQACRNAESEISDWDFMRVRNQAADAWKERLSGVSITPGKGVSEALQKTFFSGIYRTMMSPQNYTGENPLWVSNEPYFDSYYCTWDAFRTDFPFLLLTQPDALAQMIRSYLNIYQHVGWLPDCRMQLCKGYTQGGSNADVVIGDAFVKNLTGMGIDLALAYEAVVNDAENEPFDWGVEGRGGLQSWKTLGYVPVDDYDYLGFGPDFHSISRTLEYAYNDFTIALLAKGLGHEADYEKYLKRSGNWQNLFKPSQTAHFLNGSSTGGFTGFFQPKYMNGTWGHQNPIECSPIDEFCSYSSNPKETFESSIWEYQFFVPQDNAALIHFLGGPETFVRRLDYLHESGLIDLGPGGFNEPAELPCFQYHYAGRPGRSAYRIHTYIPAFFNASVNGLNGNDDSGATGSFIAFAMSGLFPIAGQNVYLIIPPFFESVSYTSPLTGKTARIRNINFDSAYKNIYIQSAKLDGQPYTKNWIGHEFFLNGGTLELTLGSTESKWGTNAKDLPPSMSAGHAPGYQYGE